MARNNQRQSDVRRSVDTSALPPPPKSRIDEAVEALGRKLSHAEREWLQFWQLSAKGFWLIDGAVRDMSPEHQGKRYSIRAVVYQLRTPTGRAARREKPSEVVQEEQWKYKIHLPANAPGETSEESFDHFVRALFAVKDTLLDADLAFLSGNSRQAGTELRRRLREQRTPQTCAPVATKAKTRRRDRGIDI